MHPPTRILLVSCLLALHWVASPYRAPATTNEGQSKAILPPVETRVSPQRPAKVPLQLKRWQKGWRFMPTPGVSVATEPGNPPLAYTDMEPGGHTAMILYRVPGGRTTPRGMEVELYLADLGSGSVRPVAAPGVVSWSRWSPGGRWYSFGVGETVDADLWLYDARLHRIMRVNRRFAADYRWLRPGFLYHYYDAIGGLHVVGVDLTGARRVELAGPGESFRGILGRDQSVVTRERRRQVYLRPTVPSAPLTAPLPLVRTQGQLAPGTVRVSPEEAFVNTVSVAEGEQRLVYTFTRSKGIPGGANTLYVDTLGVLTAGGQSWEMGLGFRGDLRDGDLTLSPDGRFLLIDYVNNTDEPAQGLYLYDLDAKQLVWSLSKRGMSPHLIGWEPDGAIVMDCTGGPPGCPAWRITPRGEREPWVPGVDRFLLAGEGWAWKTADAWWFKSPGLPVRRLLLRDLSPGVTTEEPPYFDPLSGFVRVRPAGEQWDYLLPTSFDSWPPAS